MGYRPVNQAFYEKSQAFVIAALGFLKSCLENGERIRYVLVEKSEIIAGGGFGTILEPKILYSELVDNHKKEIESLPEYSTCVQFMRSDPTISKHSGCLVGTRGSRGTMTEGVYLQLLLMEQLLKRFRRFDFDKKSFDHAYYNLERFFYNEMIPMLALSPLDNFNSDTYEIDLGEGLRIRRLTLAELEQILDRVKQPYQVTRLSHTVELEYKTQKVLGESLGMKNPAIEVDENEKFDKLVIALRLFKKGVVGFNIITVTPMTGIPILGIGGTGSPSDYRSFLGYRYSLNESEVSEFKRFWNNFSKMDLSRPASLAVAVRRFNYAYERRKAEDKIVDYMVAFEALFSKEHEDAESIGYKLSVRAAHFFERDYMKRRQIMKTMKSVYNLRSKIVHGETLKPNVEIDDIANTIEEYLRKAIRSFLEQLQTTNKDEIISHLDLD